MIDNNTPEKKDYTVILSFRNGTYGERWVEAYDSRHASRLSMYGFSDDQGVKVCGVFLGKHQELLSTYEGMNAYVGHYPATRITVE